MFSQNYEFSQLYVPPNGLNYFLSIVVAERNKIQRKDRKTLKLIIKSTDTRCLTKGKYGRYFLEAKYSSYSQRYKIYAFQ